MQTLDVKTKSVRMPVDLIKWLDEMAGKNYRNFSNEVVKILEDKRKESAQA